MIYIWWIERDSHHYQAKLPFSVNPPPTHANNQLRRQHSQFSFYLHFHVLLAEFFFILFLSFFNKSGFSICMSVYPCIIEINILFFMYPLQLKLLDSKTKTEFITCCWWWWCFWIPNSPFVWVIKKSERESKGKSVKDQEQNTKSIRKNSSPFQLLLRLQSTHHHYLHWLIFMRWSVCILTIETNMMFFPCEMMFVFLLL